MAQKIAQKMSLKITLLSSNFLVFILSLSTTDLSSFQQNSLSAGIPDQTGDLRLEKSKKSMTADLNQILLNHKDCLIDRCNPV